MNKPEYKTTVKDKTHSFTVIIKLYVHLCEILDM